MNVCSEMAEAGSSEICPRHGTMMEIPSETSERFICHACGDEEKQQQSLMEIMVSHEVKSREQFLQYSHGLTLDLNTVYQHLRLSERNRAVTFTYTDQQYPHHPDRFECCQVLCRESVCGRSYWEIDWTGGGVYVSVSYKSISRKEWGHECEFGRNDKSWRLYCSDSSYSFSHNNKWTKVPVESHRSHRIGVYVDHSAGTLSFYSVSHTIMTLIHSIQTTFTQPLYPGFAIVSVHSKVTLCDLTM